MSAPPPGTKRPGGGRERRQHPRAEAAWSVTLTLDDGPHTARLRDISRAGVCFFLDRPIAPMTLLALALELPGPEGVRQVRGNGAVVRCERISPGVEHYEIAVFLHDLAESERELIDELVRRALAGTAG
jgi:hypothetical protein